MLATIGVKVDGLTVSALKTGSRTVLSTTLANLSGQKVLIGNNVSSHFSANVIQLAQQNEVKFICLPSNATHLMQPLDVAFFGPMKRQWRGVLEAWKRSTTSPSQSLSKDAFPGLLNRLQQQLQTETGRNANLSSGFRATYLHPFNPSKVL
ncbi:pogo transposable element with krab domain [Plakobranchus ocellatus]|uniref:Pogo transposable element with krab domain n=1 Tax=Plakobranchus ocellatus TaxID=259542 RepID=A0AAV4B2R6_9GAST|nr:pogo transposable element with krab domain [Plakobranchus ocellatus]